MLQYIDEVILMVIKQHNTPEWTIQAYSEPTDSAVKADGLVLLLSESELDRPTLIQPKLDEEVSSLRAKGQFRAKVGEVKLLPTYGLIGQPYVLLAGIGAEASANALREAGASIAKLAAKEQLGSLELAMPVLGADREALVRALAEGLGTGGYSAQNYSLCAKGELDAPLKVALRFQEKLAASEHAGLLDALNRADIYAQAVNYARDLTNLPGNLLNPATMAEEAERLARRAGIEIQVLQAPELAAHGMGGLLAVGQGSIHPPRMIVLKYQGLDAWSDVLGLVGKGITFDTGGISLKEGKGMEEMVSDMGGAAVIMAAMEALGRTRPKKNVLAVLPVAENMPSGGAYRPGDVITSMSGRTIEVLNTDAEGRIVLADGMTYAKQLGAERIIDVATLTGAVLIALGDVATAAITNYQPFLQELLDAADRADEKLWQLPLYQEFKEMLKSDIADVKNSPGKNAGVITAGWFIGIFAEETPWIHLDTGGTAWLWSERGNEPKGGTGAMVRTLLELIEPSSDSI